MPAPTSSSFCSAAQQALVQVAGLIGEESHQQFIETDPFGEIVETDPYNLSDGINQQFTTVSRFDARDVTFTSRTITNPANGTSECEPTPQQVNYNALTTKTVDIVDAELITPTLCLDDLRDSRNGTETLQAWTDGLKDKTQYTMSRFNQQGIATGAGNKIVANGSGTHYTLATNNVAGNVYPAQAATGAASMDLLDWVQRKLTFAGAAKYAFKKVSNRPIYPVYLSEEALETILKGDPKFREDIRKAFTSSEEDSPLMGPLGSVDMLRSSAFMVIERPRRFTFAGGTYTEVSPFIAGTGATVGTPVVENSAWEDPLQTPYEEILIPNKMSFRRLAPDSDLELPGNMKYKPQDYMGNWHFDVPDKIYCPVTTPIVVGGTTYNVMTDMRMQNIRGNQGFFWAYFLLGRKFIFPQYSASIIVLRCGYQPGALTCASYSGSGA